MNGVNCKMLPLVVFICVAFQCLMAELIYSGNGETKEHWILQAREDLSRARKLKPNINVAKNVILFLGDGMGVSTVTAARILKGQLRNKTGEEGSLGFEEFPHLGLSKTYNQDVQTPDSAGTATAFLAGIKTNSGVLGLDGRCRRTDCSTKAGTEINGILNWSQDKGKAVGVVTNTRITHATPGASYAHTPERDWEGDVDMEGVSQNCTDIAKQLIDENDINVVMGGGRRVFLSKDDLDPETGEKSTKGRLDGRNLINDWQEKQRQKGRKYKYVWNQTEFDSVDPQETDFLLGLFNPSHMEYEIDRADDTAGEPSLAEMTEKALRILSKNEKGFFLLVEGGRIDHAHHETRAVKSLHDVIAFADAVQKAVDLTDESDTLIITTADHSHVFTIGGYPTRGNPIFGLADDSDAMNGSLKLALDGKPYSTLGYANGPGSFVTENATVRPDITNMVVGEKTHEYQAAVPLDSETHAAEDVAIYARGPMSHLFHGTHEQNYIAHVMAFAACVGDYSDPNTCAMAEVNALVSDNSGHKIGQTSLHLIFAFVVLSSIFI